MKLCSASQQMVENTQLFSTLVQVITMQPEVHIYTNTYKYLPPGGLLWAPDIKNKGRKCKEIPQKDKTMPETKRPTVKKRNTQVTGTQLPHHRSTCRAKTQFKHERRRLHRDRNSLCSSALTQQQVVGGLRSLCYS